MQHGQGISRTSWFSKEARSQISGAATTEFELLGASEAVREEPTNAS